MTLPLWQKQIGTAMADFFGNVHQFITRLVNANALTIATQRLELFLCR
jgi:hypothetical protein